MKKPRTVDELANILKTTTGHVKAVGTAHSWSDIADTDGVQVVMENFKSIQIDTDNKTATIGAGVTYTELMAALVKEELALDNAPAFPHISFVGSIMTGTHGFGIKNQAMSTFVREVAFVDPDGFPQKLTKAQDETEFKIFLHSFGTLGIVYEMTIQVRE